MGNFGDFIYCSICLVTDVKMFEMNPTMHRIYIDLLQVKNENHIIVPQPLFACYECTHLMFKYWEFKEKCTTAYTILFNSTAGTFEVTEKCLKKIDRKKNQLQSKLSINTDTYSIPEHEEKSYSDNDKLSVEKVKREFLANIELENTNQDDLMYMRQVLSNTQAGSNLYTDNAEEPDFKNGVYIIEVMESDESDNNVDDCFDESVENSIILDEGSKKEHSIYQSFKNNEQGSDADNQNPDCNVDSEDDELNTILSRHDVPDGNIDYNVDEEIKQAIESKNNKTVLQKVQRKLYPKVKGAIDEVLKTRDTEEKKIKGILASDLEYYEKYVTVTLLTQEEAIKELYSRRESLNYKRCKYRCEICFRGYNLLGTFQNHMKQHSEEEGPFECYFCKIRKPKKRNIRTHIENCHKYKFVCKHCPYVSHSISQCKSHISVHKGERHSCKLCGKIFRYAHSAYSHYRLTHQLDFPCDLCGTTFGSEKGLMAHKNLRHRREVNQFRGPKCEECNIHFTDKRAYKRHLVLSSKHKISNGCRICGEAFASPQDLKEHRRMHETYDYKNREVSNQDVSMVEEDEYLVKGDGSINRFYRMGDDGNIVQRKSMKRRRRVDEEEFIEADVVRRIFRTCTYCNTPIFSKKEFKIHTLNDHPESELASKLRCIQNKVHICEICGKTFSMESHLLVHQRIHTGEKPYSCNYCGKKFRTQIVLTTHMVTHTKEYNFNCHICGKVFGTKSVLKRHLKYHSDHRPFKCTGCDRSFVHRCEMKTHAMHVHNKVPWPARNRTDRKRKRKESESETEK